MLTLDNLAVRYNLLPSDVARKADTFDIYVMDLSAKWNKRQNDIQEGKIKETSNLNQAQLADLMYRAKEANKDD